MIKNPRLIFLNDLPNPSLVEVWENVPKDDRLNGASAIEKACFFLAEVYESRCKDYATIFQYASVEGFNLYLWTAAVANFQSGGLAVGLFGNNPTLIPYLPDVLHAMGTPELAEQIKKVQSVFPDFTNFSKNDQEYTDILNMMENPRRKVVSEHIKQMSIEDRNSYHKAYVQVLDEVEPLLEEAWMGMGNQEVFQVAERYWLEHNNKQIFKFSEAIK